LLQAIVAPAQRAVGVRLVVLDVERFFERIDRLLILAVVLEYISLILEYPAEARQRIDKVVVHFDRLAELLLGLGVAILLVVAAVFEADRLVAVGPAHIRSQAGAVWRHISGFGQGLDRQIVVRLLLLLVDSALADVGVGVIRIDLQRFVELGQGALVILEIEQIPTQAGVRMTVLIVGIQRGLELLLGQVVLFLFVVEIAQVGMEQRDLALQADRLVVLLDATVDLGLVARQHVLLPVGVAARAVGQRLG